jgi:hypothetical protein
MANRFLDRQDPTQFEEINEAEILVKILREEFPNDKMLEEGKLSLKQTEVPTPVALASRNKYSKVLELDADESASYAEYPINKLVPSVNDEELDEILLDEFEFYLSEDEGTFAPPAPDGLFLKVIELDATPFDFHDLYLKQGPETMYSRVARGEDPDRLINDMFCIWYIERGVARPIPNYKTLEVMLVERGSTYADIAEAQPEDFTTYDLRLDGRYLDNEDVNELGEVNPPATLLDELTFKSVTDRSYQWSPYIRFKSGYTLGSTTTGNKFWRDPGDYLQLLPARILTTPSQQDIEDVRSNAKGLEWPRLSATQDVCPRLYRYFLSDTEYLDMKLIKADPEDFYQDACLLAPTDLEVFRGQYEGKLLILKWPTRGYVRSIIENGTSNTLFDDLIFDLRFMIHGHLKGVLSLRTLKDIARFNSIDISNYEGGLEDYPVNELTGQLLDARSVDDLDDEQFEALSAQNGIIQILAQAGAIVVLGESRIDTGVRRIWDDFSQVVQVNRLDPLEYERYRRYESNNLDMFGVEELEPFEPRGSLIYYPMERYEILQEQAIQQEFFDAALIQIKELFPPIAAKSQEFTNKLSGIQGGFAGQVRQKFNFGSDLYKILSPPGGLWVFNKKKNNGKVKSKGSEAHFFRLFEKEGTISRQFSKSEENDIWYNSGNPWMINTLNPGSSPNAKDQNGKATALMGYDKTSDIIRLISDPMRHAGTEAQRGSGPRHQIGDTSDSPGDGAPQRYGRPERAGRQRQQMKDGNYFKLCIAQYILEVIIDPDGVGLSGIDKVVSTEPPNDVITGDNTVSLIEQAIVADSFLAELTAEVETLSEYISTIDGRLIRATTVEELEDILNVLTEARDYYESIDTDLFVYLNALEDYIHTSYIDLGKKIVNAVNKVRKRVHEKKSKYWIAWPSQAQTIASQFDSSDVYTKHQPDLE